MCSNIVPKETWNEVIAPYPGEIRVVWGFAECFCQTRDCRKAVGLVSRVRREYALLTENHLLWSSSCLSEIVSSLLTSRNLLSLQPEWSMHAPTRLLLFSTDWYTPPGIFHWQSCCSIPRLGRSQGRSFLEHLQMCQCIYDFLSICKNTDPSARRKY